MKQTVLGPADRRHGYIDCRSCAESSRTTATRCSSSISRAPLPPPHISFVKPMPVFARGCCNFVLFVWCTSSKNAQERKRRRPKFAAISAVRRDSEPLTAAARQVPAALRPDSLRLRQPLH